MKSLEALNKRRSIVVPLTVAILLSTLAGIVGGYILTHVAHSNDGESLGFSILIGVLLGGPVAAVSMFLSLSSIYLLVTWGWEAKQGYSEGL